MSDFHIDRIDGSSPVQAEGTIDDTHIFYFRGRGIYWQFVAGPRGLDTDKLAAQMLLVQGSLRDVERDERVFVIEGEDEQEGYLDEHGSPYGVARLMIDVCIQQFRAWLRKRALRDANTKAGEM
jgi:hypothetical protein